MTGRAARNITGRIIIRGRLILKTPAHFGNGDVVGVTDMPLLRDSVDNKRALLTGTSIAGALRAYLREVERGYGKDGDATDLAERLFGRLEKRYSVQSWLIVDDAWDKEPSIEICDEVTGNSANYLADNDKAQFSIELRHGVMIDSKTRTAENRKKYDIELLAAGTSFDIRLEFLESEYSRDLLPALATALDGLARGEIGLGMRKRRGFGRCMVGEWRVRRYDLTQPDGLIAWLEDDASCEKCGSDIFALLGVPRLERDSRQWFRIEATFRLAGSLLIRSGNKQPGGPDLMHLKSIRQDKLEPIVSGTSLAGVIRGRALRIAQTILGAGKGRELVDDMFGPLMNDDEAITTRPTSQADRPLPGSSRVVVEESVVTGGQDFVQSRVKIDRFTGGAFSTALFSEQPLFGNHRAEVKMTITLRNPANTEVGLLLLVLKDLWTGDLPLGGESGIGRGRLQGRSAVFTLHQDGKEQRWMLEQKDGQLICDPADAFDNLNKFAGALWSSIKAPAKGGNS